MGRDLYHTIITFFENRLNEHSKVDSWQRIDDPKEDDDYIYRVKRIGGLSDVIIHVSDEYIYTLNHYYQKPAQIIAGGFIYIPSPQASYNHDIGDIAQQDCISIGKIKALLGALNHEEHWNYIPKERQEDD